MGHGRSPHPHLHQDRRRRHDPTRQQRAGARRPIPRIAAYADVDECNAALGVALALGGLSAEVVTVLTAVQNDLFDVGADLCNPVVPDPEYPPLRVTEAYVTRLEGWCDEFNGRLSKLDSFILPGRHRRGGAAARRAHGRPARRTLGLGADRGRSRTEPARSRQSISTGSRICCSSWEELPTPAATSSGSPAAAGASNSRPADQHVRPWYTHGHSPRGRRPDPSSFEDRGHERPKQIIIRREGWRAAAQVDPLPSAQACRTRKIRASLRKLACPARPTPQLTESCADLAARDAAVGLVVGTRARPAGGSAERGEAAHGREEVACGRRRLERRGDAAKRSSPQA